MGWSQAIPISSKRTWQRDGYRFHLRSFSYGGRDAPPILRTNPPAAAVRRKRVEPLCNLAREIGDISHRHDDDMVGTFAHHQVDGIAPLEQAEIGAIHNLRLVLAIGVTQLPARSRVRIRSVQARYHHLGPVKTSDVALEDRARQVFPLLVLLRQENLM